MKTKHIIVILLVFLTVDCVSQTQHKFIDNKINVDNNNVPTSEKQFYFPTKLFPKVETVWKKRFNSSFIITTKIIENEVDSFHLIWYSRFLYAMQEPLLYNRQLNKLTYRFTWLRTFHNPVMIRIEKDTMGISLYWKVTDGQGGYEPGKIITNNKKELTSLEWNKFISIVNSTNFWEMKREASFGEDGSEWILEGVEPTKYYVTSAWTPSKESDFYRLGDFLLKLTDLKIKEEDKY